MTYPLGGEVTINPIFLPTFPKIHIKFGLSAGKMACTGCTPKFATAENDYIGYLFNKQPSQYKVFGHFICGMSNLRTSSGTILQHMKSKMAF